MLTVLGRAASIGSRAVGLALLLSLGSSRCATAPPVPSAVPTRPLRSATLDEVLAAYDGYCKGIETLSASGDLDVRDLRAGRSQKLGVRVVASRGGRLYLKGSVAVVTALEIVSNGERFWFQVPSKKTVWTGDATGAPQPEADQPPYQSLRPRDITTALLPERLEPAAGESLILEADRLTFALTLARLSGGRGFAVRRVWLTRETLLPIRVRSYDEQGDLVSEVSLGAWRDGTPRSVEILRQSQGYEASFTFSKVDTNVAAPEKAFAPRRTPDGYRVVEVRH